MFHRLKFYSKLEFQIENNNKKIILIATQTSSEYYESKGLESTPERTKETVEDKNFDYFLV